MVEIKETELTAHEAELYDRQIRLWGLESQKRLRASKILISGLSGLGAEVAKNIILAGVKSVVFLDDKNVNSEDRCSQFLTPIESQGQNRAEASLQRARCLNPMVDISADKEGSEKKTEEFFGQFDVVVLIGAHSDEMLRVDSICREKNIKFFAANVWGMFGYSFADLAKHEFVEDVVRHKKISKPHEKLKTEVITSTVKRELTFPSIQPLFDFDFNTPAYLKKLKRTGPSLLLLTTLLKFRKNLNRDPQPDSRDADILELIKLSNGLTATDGLVPENYFEHVFAQISPVAAIVGGELAQEIIKTVSQKEAPHHNVFLFDPETCCGFIESIGPNEN